MRPWRYTHGFAAKGLQALYSLYWPLRLRRRLADWLGRYTFFKGPEQCTILPHKIANYCSCLETLVSTAGSEISHQVAERIAVLLDADGLDPRCVYRNVKSAYATRSKLVHGSELRSSASAYHTQTSNCDDYIRRLIRTIRTDSDVASAVGSRPQELNEYFLSRILGRCSE